MSLPTMLQAPIHNYFAHGAKFLQLFKRNVVTNGRKHKYLHPTAEYFHHTTLLFMRILSLFMRILSDQFLGLPVDRLIHVFNVIR
jgi:hypothetical protein